MNKGDVLDSGTMKQKLFQQLSKCSIYAIPNLISGKSKRKLFIEDIAKMTCDFYHVSQDVLTERNRRHRRVMIRFAFMYACEMILHLKEEEIASFVKLDRTSINHGVNVVYNTMWQDEVFKREMEALLLKIRFG